MTMQIYSAGGGGRGGWATLVVAASNASTASKAKANYTCVGTADESTINTALGALPA